MPVVTMPSRNSGPPPPIALPVEMLQPEASSSHHAPGVVRRRGSMEQGRALEALGHAVEYLVDSRLFVLDDATVRSDGEAVQIMMRLSRAVFAECPEVISLRRRLRMWVVDRMGTQVELNQSR